MTAGKFQPGEVLHLVKKIVEHHTPGSGLIRTTELTTLTHVSVVVLGKTVGRNPTIDEQVQMEARAKRAMAADEMLEALIKFRAAALDKLHAHGLSLDTEVVADADYAIAKAEGRE